MRHLVFMTTIVVTIFLFGCVKNPQNYLTHAQTIQVLKTSVDTQIKSGKSYYPVLNVNGRILPITQSSSLVPPNSNVQRFEGQTRPRGSSSPKGIIANLQQDTQGTVIMIIAEKSELAWAMVGNALQKTPYQILDQDRTLGSYYILDVKSTNNKIIKTTPIYRVYLKSCGNQTRVFLLNKDNQPVQKKVTQQILTAIQQEIL